MRARTSARSFLWACRLAIARPRASPGSVLGRPAPTHDGAAKRRETNRRAAPSSFAPSRAGGGARPGPGGPPRKSDERAAVLSSDASPAASLAADRPHRDVGGRLFGAALPDLAVRLLLPGFAD